MKENCLCPLCQEMCEGLISAQKAGSNAQVAPSLGSAAPVSGKGVWVLADIMPRFHMSKLICANGLHPNVRQNGRQKQDWNVFSIFSGGP
jgi:hypothetical protein